MAKTQSIQKITVTGLLVENNVKIAPSKNDPSKIYATGSITLEAGDGNQIKVNILQGKTKQDGTENKLFSTVANLFGEGATTKTVAEHGRENADVISMSSGSFGGNAYYNDDGNLVSFPNVKGLFFNKVKEANYKPEAKFEVECVIVSKVPETKGEEGEATGRLIINANVFEYNGESFPIRFFAGVDATSPTATPEAIERGNKAVAYIDANHDEGGTVKYNGFIITNTIVNKQTQEVEFGDPIESERIFSRTEYLINSGTGLYEEELGFSDEAKLNGTALRNARLEKLKAEYDAKKQANNAFGGASGGTDAYSTSVDNGMPQF